MRNTWIVSLAVLAMMTASLAPSNALAARRHHRAHYRSYNGAYAHRQKTKNSWRNAAIASGALGVVGLATHNGTMTTLGAAGAGYSAYRYEQDRKSQSRMRHHRRRRRR